MKVMTFVGTRPEVIKLSRVIAELDKHVEHVLVHTGQNFDYALNGIFFDQLCIREPDEYMSAAAGSAIATIANVLTQADAALELHKPDAVLVLGDTNSCYAVLAAKRRQIPVFHMEAGNRCFDQRVPEEINRKLIDHISDINMPYTEHARHNLLAEGLPADRIIKTGSPMHEVLERYAGQIDRSDVLSRLTLVSERYFVVSAHREENVDSRRGLLNLVDTVEALAKRYCLPIVVSLHPRTRKRLEDAQLAFAPHVRVLEPLGFFDYVKLQSLAKCVISDSGTLTEEAALIGFPAVTTRQAHERPEGMDNGILIMSDLKPEKVLEAVDSAVALLAKPEWAPVPPPDYIAPDLSRQVVKIILSYTDYVRRNVWRQT